MSWRSWRLMAVFFLAAPGCKKAPPTPRDLAIASAMASGSPSARPVVPTNPFDDAATPPPGDAEATRATLAHPGYAETVGAAREVLDKRFPGIAPDLLGLQVTSVAEGQRAVLVTAPQPGPRPYLFLLDDQRRVRWSKERPTGGLDGAVENIALTSGSKGEVLLSFCDPSSKVVAARKWDNEGGLIIDFPLLDMEECGPIAALRWPGHGWLVVAANAAGTKAQLLTEAGKLPWGRDGRSLRETGDATGARAIAIDDEDSFVALGLAKGESERGSRHVAMRYDGRGLPAWRTPLEVGEAPAGSTPARPRLDRVRQGVVRTVLPRKAAGGAIVEEELEITSDGRVLLR